MDKSKLQAKVDKLEVLRKRGEEGEREAAEKALDRLFDLYGLKPTEGMFEDDQVYKITGLNPYQKEMMGHIVYKYDGTVFTWKSSNNFKTILNIEATPTNYKKIMKEYKAHKGKLGEYLEAMTDSYITQNSLCKFRKATKDEVAKELSGIEKMMRSMNLETKKESTVFVEETKQIGIDDDTLS